MHAFVAFYLALMGLISLYGIHRHWLAWGSLRRRPAAAGTAPARSRWSSYLRGC